MILSSMDPKRLNADPQPFERNGERADMAHANPDYEPGVFGRMIDSSRWTYAPREEYDPLPVHPFNPMLDAFRDFVMTEGLTSDTSQEWIDALGDPTSGVDRGIQEAISEAMGIPRGPGWEDMHWTWTQQATEHALKVLTRLRDCLAAR